MLQQRGDVLADIVVARALPEILCMFAIVLERALGELVQFLRRERLGRLDHSTILPRPALSCPRLTLLSTRRRCEPLVGRVGLRCRGTLLALSMSSCKRASASSRLRSCVRYPRASRADGGPFDFPWA